MRASATSGRGASVALTVAATGLGACASAWEAHYVGDRAPPVGGAPLVRAAPPERVQAAWREFDAEVAASDTHPDDWPPERHAARMARLLSALQITDPPASLRLLGQSQFQTTDRLDPADGSLGAFASRIGATRVAWSSWPAGTVRSIESAPVTTWTTGSFRVRPRDGDIRTEPYDEIVTTYIPIVVDRPSTLWSIYFFAPASSPPAATPAAAPGPAGSPPPP